MLEYVESDDFDRLLVETVQTTFPAHEHEHFVAHYRGLLDAWAKDQRVHRVASSSASSIHATAARSASGSADFSTTSTSGPAELKRGYEPTSTPGWSFADSTRTSTIVLSRVR